MVEYVFPASIEEAVQPTNEIFTEAAHLAQQEANPRDSIMRASRAYRLAVTPVMVNEALTTAMHHARNAAS